MKFSVPTNFDDNLISTMNKAEVYEVYGKLTTDFVGGCIPSYALPAVNKNKLRRHLNHVRKYGLRFNYLLNSVCLGGKELTMGGQKELRRLLDWVVSLGIDSVTVSVPFLLQLIKKEYPRLNVNVSVGANVNNISKAKYWEGLGADLINLDSCFLSRKFDLLARIRRYVKCKLQLLVNEFCLYYCPLRACHYAASSHASQISDECRGAVINYYVLNCKYLRLVDLTDFIRAIWIRPEDIHYYEEIGIDSFKFVHRGALTEDICRVVDAYTNRYYEGNLTDLLLSVTANSHLGKPDKFLRAASYFFRPLRFNLSVIYKLSKLLSGLEVYIDNRALDGFLEHFVKGNCKDGACLDCGYCQRTADKVVKMNKDYRNEAILKYKEAIDMLLSKRMSNFI